MMDDESLKFIDDDDDDDTQLHFGASTYRHFDIILHLNWLVFNKLIIIPLNKLYNLRTLDTKN